ncbi:MAG: ring-cleaving dioxygenase [Methylobacteriaceae bacterium]|nr:ring-cleaving dioxygenase [Methylobacteriaceae bacterium]
MQLTALHHVTAVTADAPRNYAFYTKTLGLRLVKKTVNQDDTSAYHLFFADGLASPGSDLTFFDWPVPRERRGTNAIVRTSLRIGGQDALAFWANRLREHGVTSGDIFERDGRAVLDFEDFEGQRLSLVDDGGKGDAHPWARSPVSPEHQIRGLGPVMLSVPDLRPTDAALTAILNMQESRTFQERGREVHVYSMGDGGAAAEVHVMIEPDLAPAQQGAGAVHHVAFRTPDETSYRAWNARLQELRIPSSGPVDRFYFKSLYFREPNGILFEIATDGPGFATDEPLESLGEKLSLPPFLESRRAQIEAGLKPLKTEEGAAA